MTRSARASIGLVVLGLAVVGVIRELPPAGDNPDKGSISSVAAKGGALRVTRAATPRPLPGLRFVDGAGAPRSLAGFRGRFVLLNVWATWCTPCRTEMPSLDRLQQALGGADFEVIALSVDRGGVFVVKDFYQELELRALQIYLDAGGEALAKLGAVGIPLTLLVDRDGRELWRVVGPVEWDRVDVIDRLRRDLVAAPNS